MVNDVVVFCVIGMVSICCFNMDGKMGGFGMVL